MRRQAPVGFALKLAIALNTADCYQTYVPAVEA